MVKINLAKPKRIENGKLLVETRRKPCSVCGRQGPNDASHIKSQGSGGPDTPWNIWPHCRQCHQVWHRVGWKSFVEKHPLFGMKLVAAGWILDDEMLGLWHPGLAEGEK